MKLRDMMFLVIGGLLVISGMVLNTLINGDAEAQVGVKDATFRNITCEVLYIKDGYKRRGVFGLDTDGDAILTIFGDDEKTFVAYLGGNYENGEMMLHLNSKSTTSTDKRAVIMNIDKNGGRFSSHNRLGKDVARLGVGSDGGGYMGTRDKFGYKK